MYAGSFVLHTLFLMLILDNPWTYGSENGNCTIAVKRGTRHKAKSGNLVTIKCPVTNCKERPVLYWYKDGDTNRSRMQNGQRHSASWMDNHLFILNISHVHKNDSGQYHCAGTVGDLIITGHTTEVIILGENEQFEFENATNTTEDDGAAEKKKQWIIYSLSLLGALCLLAVSCFGLLNFARKNSAKNKKTDDILQSEMNVFTVYTTVEHCNDSTIHDSDEGFMCHNEGAKSCLLHFRDGSADYDNAAGTIPNPACDYSVLTIHHPLPATQETLIYATLKHDEHFQRSEPSVETECIEYAAIGMKK